MKFETDAVTVTLIYIFLLIVLISWKAEAFQQSNLLKFTIPHGLFTTNTSKNQVTMGIFPWMYSITKASSSREVFQYNFCLPAFFAVSWVVTERMQEQLQENKFTTAMIQYPHIRHWHFAYVKCNSNRNVNPHLVTSSSPSNTRFANFSTLYRIWE